MSCNSSSSLYALHWYRQGRDGGPIFLVTLQKGGDEKRKDKITAKLDKKMRQSFLSIQASQPSYAGTYLCAGSGYGANNKLTFGKGTTLSVIPDVTDPEPAVYQLKDPQSDNITLCLFTDFDSQTNVSQSASSEAFVSGNTVMDMKAMDSKSNGAIAWSNQTSFSCKDAFKKNASHPTSDVPCDAKLVEKSFETDMNLNFQNLSVMGLRILLLKVAGFNLLMTLRLWSS